MPKKQLWTGPIRTAPIPPTRDPFVNAPLIPVPPGDDGTERFWISTWNQCSGTLGALVDLNGDARIYRFDQDRHPGFYSAVAEDSDTLWLCGDLACVVRLSLSSGKYQTYRTGAPAALVFQGMAFDRSSGKLFAVAFPPPNTAAFCFDTRSRQPVKVYPDIGTADHYMRASFQNADGTWSIVLQCPGETLLKWNPKTDAIAPWSLTDPVDAGKSTNATIRIITDERRHGYIPDRGWLDPVQRRFRRGGPRPEREMTWFARTEKEVFGCARASGHLEVAGWTLKNGKVRSIGTLPDCHWGSVAISQSGKLVAVTMYGDFYRFDLQSSALECTRRLPAEAHGAVDCIRRIGPDRVLGTPFITQRFWETNLATRKGFDCGRAAPGAGEVLQTWRIRKKIYMAAYTGAELVEYDPARPPRFPENPRVVAKAPGGMRPVAAADDGRRLYTAASRHYGQLGSILTCYDTVTGNAVYAPDPLPRMQISSLAYDRASHRLLCGASIHADCQSCPPVETAGMLAWIAADDFSVVARTKAPLGAPAVRVEGLLGVGSWLCTYAVPGRGTYPFAVGRERMAIPEPDDRTMLPGEWRRMIYAGRPGYFVVHRGAAVELWDLRHMACVSVLYEDADVYRVDVDGTDVFLCKPKQLIALEGALRRSGRRPTDRRIHKK